MNFEMKKLTKIWFLILLNIIFSFISYSQNEKPTRKNYVFVQPGIGTYNSLTINYQHFFKIKNGNKSGISSSFGTWFNVDLFGFFDFSYGLRYDLGYQFLKKIKNNEYFDFELGVVLNQTLETKNNYFNKKVFPDFYYKFNLTPKLNFGFRAEFDNHLFFRIGIGLPEIFKLSFGTSF